MLVSGLLFAVSALAASGAAELPGACAGASLEDFEERQEALVEIRAQLADDGWSADACERLRAATMEPRKSTAGASGTLPTITLTPGSYRFDGVPIGSTASVEVTVANPSAGTVTFAPNYPRVAASNGAYAIANSTCGDSLASGASCTITAQFAPTRTGTVFGFLDIRLLEVTSLFSTTFIGRAASENTHALSYSPETYSFGTVNVGSVQAVAIVASNTGNSPITFEAGYPLIAASSGHRIAESSCGASLDVGMSCTLLVEYAPTTTGFHSAFLDIRLQESYRLFTATITSTAEAPLTYTVSMDPASVDFGAVKVGERVTASIRIENTGTGAVTFANNAPSVTGTQQAFRMSESTCLASLPAGQQCFVDVEFTPTVPGDHFGWLDVRLVEASGMTSTNFRATVEAALPPEIFSNGFEVLSR